MRVCDKLDNLWSEVFAIFWPNFARQKKKNCGKFAAKHHTVKQHVVKVLPFGLNIFFSLWRYCIRGVSQNLKLNI